MTTIDIRDLGPIQSVSIPVPAEGGVVVLRGKNGAGKSIAISAVDALTREGKPSPAARAREGSIGGSIEGLGRSIRVGMQRSTSKGELEVASIGDDVDVAALVDPGFVDPAAADRARVRAALVLARVKVSPERFAELVGGMETLQRFARPETLAATDPVEMAEKVRRDLHASALALAKTADRLEATAAGLRESLTMPADPIDEVAVRGELEAAVRLRAELVQRQELARRNRGLRATALARIESAGQQPDLQALEDAETTAFAAEEAAGLAEQEALAALEQAKLRVTQTRAALVSARAAREAAREAARAARDSVARLDAAHQALEAIADVAEPGQAEVDAAGARVVAAHQAAERLGIMREEAARRAESDQAAEKAKQARIDSEALREAARGTDGVLADAIAEFAPAGLTIRDGRLVFARDGQQKYFADLSDGERWKVALDLAIDALGDARILAISQLAWEGLDADARAAINAHAKQRQTVIVTAEADHNEIGPLRAEVF
jgi:hypothetical protein